MTKAANIAGKILCGVKVRGLMGSLSFSMGLIPEVYGLQHCPVNTERPCPTATGRVADIDGMQARTGWHTSPNEHCRLIRATLPTRKTFFDDLRALTRYLHFPSWEGLLRFMMRGLEIGPYAKPT